MHSAHLRRVLLLLLLVSLAACRAARPSDLPRDQDWIVAVKSARLASSSAWFKRFAHHTWVDVKRGSESKWERHECLGAFFGIAKLDLSPEEARLDRRFEGAAVRLLGVVTGEDARLAAEHIDARSSELANRYDGGYHAWPGPNSNTYVAELARGVPELAFVFDPNALGKDFDGWFGIGRTASKTGVRIDTPILGAAIGLREGVELHVLQLTFGVSFDPPGVSLPFLPQIPFGWSSPDEQRLPEPEVAALRTFVIDEHATSERIDLGTLPDTGTFVLRLADGSAWLQVDFTIDPIDEHGARTIDLATTRHGLEGTNDSSSGHRLDKSRIPVDSPVYLGGAQRVFDFVLGPNGEVLAGLRLVAPK